MGVGVEGHSVDDSGATAPEGVKSAHRLLALEYTKVFEAFIWRLPVGETMLVERPLIGSVIVIGMMRTQG